MNPTNLANSGQTRLPNLLTGAVFVLCTMPLAFKLSSLDQNVLSSTIQTSHSLHMLLEWSAFYTTLSTVLLALIHFCLTRHAIVLIIGVGIGCMGLMDGLHILISDGLLINQASSPMSFTWTVSRYFAALLLAITACFTMVKQSHSIHRNASLILLNTIVFGGLVLGFAHFYVAGGQSHQSNLLHLIASPPNDTISIFVLFLCGMLLFHRLHAKEPNALLHAMVISFIPNMSAQVYMSFLSKTPFDTFFYVAHALKVIAYLLPFIGMAMYHIRSSQQTITALEPLNEPQASLVTQTAALEQREAELEEFNYIAAHDLQGPVRKLIAFCHHLRRDLGTNLPKRAEQDIHYIMDTASRMQVLMQTLLTFSQAGRTAVKYEWISVDDCVDDVLSGLATRLQESQATISRDPLPAVWGDPRLLSLIYQNLIDNALKFVAQRQPVIQLTAEQSPEGWILGVQDCGIGIKPEHMEPIFVPFKRLHGHSEYAGSGVGLAICRKAVERQHGRIWVESQPGDGAHFKFVLGTASVGQDSCVA
ncbi:MAG: ATP-binding protein [bacterium]|nr:ATP-binding protein [bacterium]